MQRILLSTALIVVLAAPAAAQTGFARGWVDVNFGVSAAAEKKFTTATTIIVSEEPADFSAAYRLPTGASFDFGGGVMITPQVGIGISFSGTATEEAADLRVRIPHPLYFNSYASDAAPTDSKLRRVEGGVHVQLVVVPYDRNGVRFRIFGGPSRLRIEQDAVEDIRYNQLFGIFNPSNEVRITEFRARTIDGTAWGVHVGADVSWFLSRVVGLGGFARYSRASVELDDPFDEGTMTLKAGGMQAGGGVRFRF